MDLTGTPSIDKFLAWIHSLPSTTIAIGFLLIWLLAWLPIAFPRITKIGWHPFKPLPVEQKLPLVGSLYLIVPLLLWGACYVTGLQFSAIGLVWQVYSLWEILAGLVIGASSLLMLFGCQIVLGWITSQVENWQIVKAALLPALFIGLWVSVTEEVVFRGFLQSLLQQDYNVWLVAAIVSLVFALLHAIWEGQEALPQLPGLWLMAMVLAIARWTQGGNLGLAIGLHAGWIWIMATLVSSQAIVPTGRGPEILTGFGQKPLAGLLGLIFLCLTGCLLVASAHG